MKIKKGLRVRDLLSHRQKWRQMKQLGSIHGRMETHKHKVSQHIQYDDCP